ncbi:MAG: right-handed parallel beta-helix repeat-containing protein, partial [Chloroflexi bacterium]|nr:right-handed parallel beta-helix repeat-containing protein [Chloroflexota bacterium]
MSAKVRFLTACILLASLFVGMAPVATAGGPWYVSPTGNDSNDCLSWAMACQTIQAAVDKASSGDTINVGAGTYNVTSTITLNKAGLTITGQGDTTVISVSGASWYVFSITANDVTIENLKISKTDKTGVHNLIYIGADGVTIRNNTIHGQWVQGDGEVTRAMEIAYGSENLTISGNTIYGLRQPAYINGSAASPTTGTIANNDVSGTRGWVIAGANMTFTDNTWGTGANPNYVDIAILSGTDPGYYPDIVALSEANHNAVVEDQRVSPAVLSDVFVDASAAAGGDGTPTKPYQTIGPAIARAVEKGTINVAAGEYQEQVVINKDLTLVGASGATIKAPASPSAFKFPESSAWWEPVVIAFGGTEAGGEISGSDVVQVDISGFTVDGNDRAPTSGYRSAGILLRNVQGTIASNTVQNMHVDGAQTFGIIAYGHSDVVIDGNTVSGYARGGITANGDLGTSPDPHAVIKNNAVTGPGLGVPVKWAPNGIQIGWGATGEILTNTVRANGWPGTDWTGSGIIIAGSEGVLIQGNTVTGNETGIAVVGDNYFGSGLLARNTAIKNNTVSGNTYGVSLQDRTEDTLIEGNTITSQEYDGIDICDFHGIPPTNTVIRNNAIYGNNTANDLTSGGLWVEDTINTAGAVNAEANWWGDETGPYHAEDNPSGQGDAIIAKSGVVDFEPWLGTGPLWQLVEEADENATITLAADTTYPGGAVIDKPLTLIGQEGTVIGPGSDGIVIASDDVALENITFDGTGGDPGDVGIRVQGSVSRLRIEGCEVRDWPDDGIHFNGAITDLQIVDNYIHENGGDGIEFTEAPAGTAHIYGNAFRSNTGYGINAVSGSVTAEYNEWGDIAGPTGPYGDGVSGSVDYDPWVFGKVYAVDASGREGETVTVDIQADVANLYGVQFSLTFDKTKLQVQSTQDSGTGYFKGSENCSTTYDNDAGTLSFFCTRRSPDGAVSGTEVKLLSITFNVIAEVDGNTTTTIDLDADSVRLGALGGVNIYVDSVTDGTATLYGTTDVSGRVDLQGRTDDAGAVVTFPLGPLYGGGTDTTDSWGRYDFTGVTDGSYNVTIEMARYLDAAKMVNVQGDTMDLGTVLLLGGDVDDSDTIVINDLTAIGGKFGQTVDPATTNEDINYDSRVDILDLVLAGGNYDLSE